MDVGKVNDKKTFWKTVKPKFSNKSACDYFE